MNKKIIFILGIVIALAVAGIFLYLERPAEVIENQEVVEDPERPAEVIENQEVIENNEVVKEPEEPIVPIDKVAKLSSCVILDEEYCDKGEPIYDEDGRFIGLGFDLPEGTKIYAPFDGFLDYPVGDHIYAEAFYLGISVEENPFRVFDALGAIKPFIEGVETREAINMHPVVRGQVIAKIYQSQTIKVITPDGMKDYPIILRFREFNPATGVISNDFERLEQFFGYIDYSAQ